MVTTITIVFVLYLALMLAISWKGRKHGGSFDEYLSVGRKTPMLLLIGGAVGAQVGNGLVVGGAAEGANIGMSGVAYGLACALSYSVVFFFSKRIYNSGYMLPAEYFREKYNSRAMSNMYHLIVGIGTFPGTGAQIMAAKVLFDALGLNSTYGVIALCVVVFLYSQISGLWGAYATSVVQVVIIAVGVIAAVGYIIFNGGWAEIAAAAAAGAVPESYMNFSGYDLTGWLLLMLPTMLVSPIGNTNWQRIHSADSEKSARHHLWISTLVMIPICLAPVIIGMYGRVHYNLTGNTAFFGVILESFPPILAALVVVAAIAAVMSTIDGSLLAASASFLRGLYKDVIDKDASDEKLQKLTLPLNIIVILISSYFAFTSNSIVSLLSSLYIFTGGALLAPLLFGWFWKKTTTQGAIAGVVAGTIYGVLQMFNIYSLPYKGVTYVLPSCIALIIVSLLTQDKAKN